MIERGLVGLDDEIDKYLPEWKDPQILVGFEREEDGEKPVLIPAQSRITLRYTPHFRSLLYPVGGVMIF